MTHSFKNSPVIESSLFQDDAAVVTAARSGDREAFGELVKRYQSYIHSFLLIRLRDPHDAEDLAQDTFVTAFQNLEEFDSKLPFGPWLRGIAFNLLRNFLRKKRSFPIGDEQQLAELIDVRISQLYAASQQISLFTALEDCMGKLDPAARHLVHRRYRDRATVQDIATESKRNHSTVTMQLHRLRASLAECIRGNKNSTSE